MEGPSVVMAMLGGGASELSTVGDMAHPAACAERLIVRAYQCLSARFRLLSYIDQGAGESHCRDASEWRELHF